MLKFFQKLRKSKKGFTLIELIVVIAILAILAAILVPAMIAYIERAQDQTHQSDCRNAYSSAAAAFTTIQTDPTMTPITAQAAATQGPGTDLHDETMRLLGNSFDSTLLSISASANGIESVTYDGWRYNAETGEITEVSNAE